MRIVIDMQGAQTESNLRGIGRYTLAFTQALVRNRGEHEIILALNGMFAETIASIRASFHGLLPEENIRVWHAPAPVRESVPGNTVRRESAELIREAFLAGLQADVVHLTSLFEGYRDDAVTSIGRFDQTTATSAILYDLIPLLNPDQYLKPEPAYRDYYLRKIEHIRRAALLLAISESSKQEGIDHLAVPLNRITNISAAVDDRFRPISLSGEQKRALLSKYGICRPFAMYAGASDSRKNIDGLIRAYALLPADIRSHHQLVVVSSLNSQERSRLETLRLNMHLAQIEVVFTGFVPDDELLMLYNLCTVFVLPSLHEGFGLPALEAMACGRAVIGSNTSSLPEVIGRDDALFDPANDRSIAEKMEHVLNDDAFRASLERHGLERARQFSWDITGRRAIAALENFHAEHSAQRAAPPACPTRKAKLAYVSPMPPERTGIAVYSTELLPALRAYFDIELITDQLVVDLPPSVSGLPVRSVAWFEANGQCFDRVVYHIGNSPFHSHMLGLAERHRGVIMLHDFFLSALLADGENSGRMPGIWTQSLYHSHGYRALQERFNPEESNRAKEKYPCNLEILQAALGIVVHSAHSQRLAREWYGAHAADGWHVVPHLRQPPASSDRIASRRALGISEESFVVCSFGFVDPTKLSHRLLDAWFSSVLYAAPNCELVFVGTNHGGDYGLALSEQIRKSEHRKRIRITGWADMEVYEHYLQAADVGVQLRCMSRGETSGAVLDCLNYGLPTIINAHGSMADIPEGATWKLPDNFDDADLVQALETLWRDQARRSALNKQALHIIRTYHAPAYCASLYHAAIETSYQAAATDIGSLIGSLAKSLPRDMQDQPLKSIADAIATSIPVKPAQPQLLVDVSTIVRNDLRSGIERVVRGQLSQLLREPPCGFRVEPVYLSNSGGKLQYRYARQYAYNLLAVDIAAADEPPVDAGAGDVFYGADFCPGDVIQAEATGIYSHWRNIGVKINFMVYDLLPVLRPEFFPDETDRQHSRWLECIVGRADHLICISHAVADDLRQWVKQRKEHVNARVAIDAVHIGADLSGSFPSMGVPKDSVLLAENMAATPCFLMVGTIEPRKGHLQALAGFDELWREGSAVKLIIVGKEGWTSLPRHQRRTIPLIMEKLHNHPELGKSLIWLSDVSDEYLQRIYAACTCVIFPSEAEGFGLPLIEAARFQCPIIARNIPIFREVAQEHAYFFDGLAPADLARAIRNWLVLHTNGSAPSSHGMQYNTWSQHVEKLTAILTKPAQIDQPAAIEHEAAIGSSA